MASQHLEAGSNLFGQFFGHHDVIYQQRQGTLSFAAFRGEDAADCVKIQGIGHQRIESFSGDCDDLPASDCGSCAFYRRRAGPVGVNFNKVGGHYWITQYLKMRLFPPQWKPLWPCTAAGEKEIGDPAAPAQQLREKLFQLDFAVFHPRGRDLPDSPIDHFFRKIV